MLQTLQAGIGISALSALDLQRKRSLERLRANQRAAAAASPPPVRLERLTSAERHDILGASPAAGSVSPFGVSGLPLSRRPSTLATVPSEVRPTSTLCSITDNGGNIIACTPAELDGRLRGHQSRAASAIVAVCIFRNATASGITLRPASQEQEPAPPHIALDIPPVSKPTELPRRGLSDATEASEAGGDAGLALELEVLRSEEIAAGGAAGGNEDQVPAGRVPARIFACE